MDASLHLFPSLKAQSSGYYSLHGTHHLPNQLLAHYLGGKLHSLIVQIPPHMSLTLATNGQSHGKDTCPTSTSYRLQPTVPSIFRHAWSIEHDILHELIPGTFRKLELAEVSQPLHYLDYRCIQRLRLFYYQ